MDITSILGLLLALASLAIGYTMDGGNLGALYLLSAIVIVAGGALGSVAMSYGFNQFKRFPVLLASLFISPKNNMSKTIDFLVMLSENARRDGLLSLEKIIEEADQQKQKVDPFLKKGIMMVIDGADLEQIKDQLETEIFVYEQKNKSEISMFESLAQYAPAYGMIGTIIGLIQVLANMESPQQMAAAIAIAFITTLYGVVIANALCLPAANKLKIRLNVFLTEKQMVLEGICGIRNGANPKMLREKLSPYLSLEGGKKPKAKEPDAGAEGPKGGR